MTDRETQAWLDDQQRKFNQATYRRWPETQPPKRRYKFEPWQLAAAIKSLQKADK